MDTIYGHFDDLQIEEYKEKLHKEMFWLLLYKDPKTKDEFKNVDFEFYKNLHKYVFGDIYEWAGTIRTVDMSKKGTRFCPADKIEERGQRIFQKIINLNFLGNIKEDEFIVEFTDLYCDLNYLHPFREGNGRIQRLFLSMLVNSLGKSLNFSQIDADYLMIATIKSVSGDIFMLRDIFREYIAQN